MGKCTIKVLKSALIDFYSDKDISAAKTRLLNDLRSMNFTEKTPHLPMRREGDNRLAREVDDMITVFTFLDERKLLDNLPKYVADGPDNMPTTRLYEGDLKVFMDQLVRMDEKMAVLSSTCTGDRCARRTYTTIKVHIHIDHRLVYISCQPVDSSTTCQQQDSQHTAYCRLINRDD